MIDRDKLWFGAFIAMSFIGLIIILNIVIIEQRKEISECLRVTKDLNHQLEWAINNKTGGK